MTPEGWKEQKIEDVLTRVGSAVDVQPDEQYQQIGIRSHAKGLFDKPSVSGVELGNKRVFWVEPNCFVVNIVFAWEQAVGRTTEKDVGKIASHRFPMYRPKNNKADVDFFLYLFKSKYGKHLLTLASPGGAGRNKTLGQSEFSKTAVSIPPLAEQQEIAKILSTWDQAIEATERLIENSKDQKQALLQGLLTGKRRLPGFSQSEWLILPFENIARKSSRNFTPGKGSKVFRCIELEHIEPETGRLLSETTTKETESNKTHFTAKSILFGKLRPYLRKFLKPGFDGVCTSEIWVLDAVQSVCSRDYLYFLVQSGPFLRATSISSGSKMPRADWQYVKDSLFHIPKDKEEQAGIAEVLTRCEVELDRLETQLESLRDQKKALMQQLLTGKRRVKLDGGD
ncbi:restriction endonuclease subunit S [Roseovarius aestuarii]|uniref:Type I restriction modification DNA specificity domain protein n=1 Tax=Roseovarius aestuarii TaxID=475083 RepID=A0A1X7BVN5_9RHOB|nr:restriction endonuclease subunit S [Roseovarius aestuarii]SMC13706.1 Type I restriction modification DNA specificity domain protein [Roseovarius aestuarii]